MALEIGQREHIAARRVDGVRRSGPGAEMTFGSPSFRASTMRYNGARRVHDALEVHSAWSASKQAVTFTTLVCLWRNSAKDLSRCPPPWRKSAQQPEGSGRVLAVTLKRSLSILYKEGATDGKICLFDQLTTPYAESSKHL